MSCEMNLNDTIEPDPVLPLTSLDDLTFLTSGCMCVCLPVTVCVPVSVHVCVCVCLSMEVTYYPFKMTIQKCSTPRHDQSCCPQDQTKSCCGVLKSWS